ncbi:hypothetical protein CDD83_9672 [Cordyceps sp. RAO-2017]|nr:hypothetical protein CDD83_9672 [Cordyceps sp. RAO-2017]
MQRGLLRKSSRNDCSLGAAQPEIHALSWWSRWAASRWEEESMQADVESKGCSHATKADAVPPRTASATFAWAPRGAHAVP